MDEWLQGNLVCPRDRQPLEFRGDSVRCAAGHEYPCVDGIPVLLVDEVEPTHDYAFATTQAQVASGSPGAGTEQGSGVDPFVQQEIAATNGILYVPLIGKLATYPIPELRLPEGGGRRLLDVGCNWGRWSIAAARKGYRVVGVDPSLAAVRAAQRVARQLGVDASYVVSDARFLPFRDGCFDVAFSYSVLQHFSKPNAHTAFAEIGRVLRDSGMALVQMPNAFGIRCLYHQARRGFREAEHFEVRYWTPAELRRAFEKWIGPSELSVDGFFGLGIQKSDLGVMPPAYRVVVRSSEVLRSAARYVPALKYGADSLYVHSRRRAPRAGGAPRATA